MKSKAKLALATAAVVWTWGCGGTSLPEQGSPSTAPPAASPSPAPPASSPPPTEQAPESVSIRGFTHASDGSILPGVEVCLVNASVISPPTDTAMCAVSASDGAFQVSGARADGAVTLTFRKDGFVPTARPIALQAQDVTLPSSENVLYADPMVFMGSPADSSKGQIAFALTTSDSGPAPQLSATLAGYLVPGGFGDPVAAVYNDAKGAPAPAAEAGASGGFVNVKPGMYAITLHPTTGFCVSTSGLYGYAATQESNGDIAILVPVIQGYMTSPVGVWCTTDGP